MGPSHRKVRSPGTLGLAGLMEGRGRWNVEALEGFPYLLEEGNRALWGTETTDLLSRRWRREVREDFWCRLLKRRRGSRCLLESAHGACCV